MSGLGFNFLAFGVASLGFRVCIFRLHASGLGFSFLAFGFKSLGFRVCRVSWEKVFRVYVFFGFMCRV